MPTIHISSDPLPVPRRRAVAVRLTRWLRTRGVAPAHVVVHFDDHRPNTVFSGGMPVEAIGGDVPGPTYASVVCQLGPDRDAAFRAEFAAELSAALGADAGSGFLYLEFRPTRADHVHVQRDGVLVRADVLTHDEYGKDTWW